MAGGLRALAVGALLVILLIGSAHAQTFSLSGLFTDNMVFQRDAPIRVWGWGIPNSKVNVTLGHSWSVTVVAANGTWVGVLPAEQAGGPYALEVEHEDSIVALKNVYVGEVLLCSGQSNMEFTVTSSFNATAEIEASINYPLIRLYTVNRNTSLTPLYNMSGMGGGWLVAQPSTVGNGNWTYFSAVCYYTGRRLFDYLRTTSSQPIAVGLVCSNWGGTEIQAWQDAAALTKCPAPKTSRADQIAYQNAHKEFFADLAMTRHDEVVEGPIPNTDSVLWNAMIFPLLGFSFKAALWDQAEQNVGQEAYYSCWFKEMITSWRETFGLPDMGFYFVQLPGYGSQGYTPLALMCLQQATALSLPLVGMAVTYDCPDPTSPWGSVHPQNKESVGERLYLSMLALTYKQSVVYQGPTYVSYGVNATNVTNQVVTIAFAAATAAGMSFQGVEFCTTCCAATQINGLWQFSDDSGKTFRPATNVTIVESLALVQATVEGLTSQVNSVSYMLESLPECALKNTQGLPAPPFWVSH